MTTPPGLAPEDVPAAFFDSGTLNGQLSINSADDLWKWVQDEIVATSTVGSTAASGLPRGDSVVYRGQADSAHGLTSSLYRLVRNADKTVPVTEARMQDSESAIVTAMRAQGIGRRMSSLELLTVLQHHGIPTRLIDFSKTLEEALFFAVDRDDAADGRLFIVEIHDDGHRILDNPGSAELPWTGGSLGTTRSAGVWTKTVDRLDALDLDPRMRAQNGTFVAGGLNRRVTGRTMSIGSDKLEPSLFPDITSLGINFVTQRRQSWNKSWGATGWNILVKAEWKKGLLKKLADLPDPITPDTMYPPLSEVKRLAVVEAKGAL